MPLKHLVLACALLLAATLGIGACSGPVRPSGAARVENPSPAVRVATPTPLATRTPRPTATFVPLVTPSPTPEILRLAVEEARARAEAGAALLVDTRAGAVFEQAHIAGAISLPANQVAERLAELPPGQLVVFYCD